MLENIFRLIPIIKNDVDGYQYIAGLYHEIKKICPSKIGIDFSSCRRFDANISAALGAILDKLDDEGYQIWLLNISKATAGVRRALTRNGFLKAFDITTNNEERENFILYRKFSTEQQEEFKQYILEELINKQKFPKHTNAAGESIQESIFEIYINSITHGGCTNVYCCGEYISKSIPETLDMTIVNLGTTIEDNVNRHMLKLNKEQLSSCECIKWAITQGNTTKDVPGGLGFTIICNFIYKNQGKLQIISSDAYWEFCHEGSKSVKMNNKFPGTIVNMEINIDDDTVYYAGEEDKVNADNIL